MKSNVKPRGLGWLLALAACLLLLSIQPARADDLTLTLPKDIRGYQDNPITVNCPSDGTLTLIVRDGGRVWRTIVQDEPVHSGENTIIWDGTAHYGERMDETDYRMEAGFTSTDGKTLTAETTFNLLKCRQALVFALGTSDVLERGGETWYLEYDIIRDGVLIIEHYHADDLSEPFYTRKLNAIGKSIRRYAWDTKMGRELLPAGDYVLRLYAEENPAWVSEISVTIRDEPEVALPVTETGRIMPDETSTDEEIWAMMTAPAVVVNLKTNKLSQTVYAQPSTGSPSLGTLHGLSQSVEVLEVRDDGWCKIGAWNHEDINYVVGYIPTEKLKVVQPKTDYGLLIDKRTQTLTVYQAGKPIGSLSVSTGQIHNKKIYQETAPGSFLTQEHMSNFSMNGCKYDYVIRYDGGNLIHQSPWSLKKGKRDYSVGLDPLGGKASHGCIRMQPEVGESGLNAYWIYTHIRYNTRVIILDDPEASQYQAAAALAGKDVNRELESLPDALPLADGETEIVITLGGDVTLGTRESWQSREDAFPAFVASHGAETPFEALAEQFTNDDLTLVSLEGILQDTNTGEKAKDNALHYRGDPALTEVLVKAGIEAVSTTNNHADDYGEAGKQSTAEALEAAGIHQVGSQSYVFEKDGVRIGLAGCRETEWRRDRTRPAQDIAALKAAGCDVVIYCCHWGTSNSVTHNDVQSRMAADVAAAGADIIVGTHPHVLQGIGRIDKAVVLWSLGDLLPSATHEPKTRDSALAELRLRFSAEGVYEGVSVRFIPILTNGEAGVNNFQPVYAQGTDAIRVMAKLQADSELEVTESMYFAATPIN